MTVTTLKRAAAALRRHALGFPGAHEEFPWGHTAIKVKGKAFLFMAIEDGELSLSTKLPSSRDVALALPFAEPTRYGLGKSGWVTATFASTDRVPVPLLRMWIDESYLAIAPASVGRAKKAAPARRRSR